MSGSEDEAFASADEGDAGASAASGKPAQDTSKSAQGETKGKGGGKQKGKQQQQQKKKKGKGPAKPAAEAKESSDQTAGGEPPAKTEKDVKDKDTSKKNESSKTAADKPKAPAESAQALKDDKAEKGKGGEKGDQQPDSKKDTEKRKSTEKSTAVKDEAKAPEKPASESKAKPQETPKAEEDTKTEAKTAGEIRKNLSATAGADKPAEQTIPRDVNSPETEQSGENAGKKGEKGGAWNWGWGSSILNAATNSLETFSSQVGEGLTTLIDSVESSLGVPDPESIAREDSTTDLTTEPSSKETVMDQPHEKEASKKPVKEKEGGEETKKKEDEDKELAADSVTEPREKEEEEEGASGGAGGGGGGGGGGGNWLTGWGSNISNMGKSLVNKSQNLMNTGFERAETLAAGGLDILENLGKKTYSTLTEHDPGLRRAREFLHHKSEKPSLSSILKEAQEEAEEKAKRDVEVEEARKCNFSALFEDSQGLAHLEALEMLSNRSERKVQALLSAMEEDMLDQIRPQLMEIKDTFQQACDTEKEQGEATDQDFKKLVTENLSDLHLGTTPDKLNKVQETVRQWIADFYSHEDHSEIADAKEVQQRAIQSLAEVTSKAVEQFHKAGELVLLQKDEEKTFLHRAQSLAKLSSVLATEVDILASKFSQCLNKIGEEKKTADEVTPMVTNVYLEASNASSYIQDAFQLLLPVLQHAAIQASLTSTL